MAAGLLTWIFRQVTSSHLPSCSLSVLLPFIAVSILCRLISSIASFTAVAARTPINGTIEVVGLVGLIAEIEDRIAMTCSVPTA